MNNINNNLVSNSNLNSVFAPFVRNNQNLLTNSYSQDSSKNDSFDKPKRSKKVLIAEISGITGFVVLGAGILFAQLSHKNAKWSVQQFRRIVRDLTNKISESENVKDLSAIQAFALQVKKATVKGFESVINVVSNFDAGKNHFVGHKATEKLGPLGRAASSITRLFKSLTEKTAKGKYDAVAKELERTEKHLKNLTDKAKKHIQELLDKAEKNQIKNQQNLDEIKKLTEIKEKLALLDDKLKGFNGLREFIEDFNKSGGRLDRLNDQLVQFVQDFDDYYKGKTPKSLEQLKNVAQAISDKFAPVELRKEANKKIRTELFDKKESFSRAIEDNCQRIRHLFKNSDENLEQVILIDPNFQKKGLRSQLKEVLRLLRNYENPDMSEFKALKKENKKQFIAKRKALREKNKENFIAKTDELIKELKSEISKLNEDDPKALLLNDTIQKLNKSVDRLVNDKKGLLEEIRDVLKIDGNGNEKNLLKEKYPEDYNKVKNSMNSLAKKLREATVFEMDNLEGRLRDIYLGSGVFEALITFILPSSILTYQIGKSDSKEERISQSLKLGLPIMGSIGAWSYSSLIKCYNGPQAMLFGLGSGLALNKIGNIINNKINNGKDLNSAKSIKDLGKDRKVYTS